MAMAPVDTLVMLHTEADLDKALQTDLPVLLYITNGESIRTDVKNELDKAAREYSGRIQVVNIDAHTAPDIAQRFEVGKHPLLIGWLCGETLGRRNRPWNTDVQGMVDMLAAHAPAGPIKPILEKIPLDTKPVKVTEKTFEADVLKCTIPVIVDFWAEWCGPCKMVAPIFEKLATEFAGKVRIAKVDIDANPGLSQAFRITSIPTIMFVKNGKIVGQQVGALPESALRDAIQQLINLKV